MATGRAAKFASALRDKCLVRFGRPFDAGWVRGFVLDVGPQWFLLAVVGESVTLNGFQCSRLSDVRNLEVPDPYARFAEVALKKRRQRLPKKPRVSVADTADLLLTASRLFPLVTIHREHVNSDVCQIGRIVGLDNGAISLLEINPDATWETKPVQYRLDEITRIDFGGGYEDALHLVGGDGPAL